MALICKRCGCAHGGGSGSLLGANSGMCFTCERETTPCPRCGAPGPHYTATHYCQRCEEERQYRMAARSFEYALSRFLSEL